MVMRGAKFIRYPQDRIFKGMFGIDLFINCLLRFIIMRYPKKECVLGIDGGGTKTRGSHHGWRREYPWNIRRKNIEL
jgi:hypothetical protein